MAVADWQRKKIANITIYNILREPTIIYNKHLLTVTIQIKKHPAYTKKTIENIYLSANWLI